MQYKRLYVKNENGSLVSVGELPKNTEDLLILKAELNSLLQFHKVKQRFCEIWINQLLEHKKDKKVLVFRFLPKNGKILFKLTDSVNEECYYEYQFKN